MKFNFKKTMPRVACVAGGAVASNVLGNKFGSKIPSWGQALAKVAVGTLLVPMVVKGANGDAIGDGFIADAALQGAHQVMPGVVDISGYGDANVGASGREFSIDEDFKNVSGYGDSNVGDLSNGDGLTA